MIQWYVWLLLVLGVVGLIMPAFLRKIFKGKLAFLSSKIFLIIYIAAAVILAGGFGALIGGVTNVFQPAATAAGAAAGTTVVTGLSIDVEYGAVQAISADSGACTVGRDSVRGGITYCRCGDADTNETSGIYEYQGNFTIIRTSNIDEDAIVNVKCWSEDFLSPSDSSDASTYNILQKNTQRELTCYLADDLATSTSRRGKFALAFSEGETTELLGVTLDLDETSQDELNDKDIVNVYVQFSDADGNILTFEDAGQTLDKWTIQVMDDGA